MKVSGTVKVAGKAAEDGLGAGRDSESYDVRTDANPLGVDAP